MENGCPLVETKGRGWGAACQETWRLRALRPTCARMENKREEDGKEREDGGERCEAGMEGGKEGMGERTNVVVGNGGVCEQ